ncbi:MAG: HEAT repeat domain-containing protein, partial [bacterium]|nr:HEAT repeat domain-containing protein [bacterium]
MRKLIIIGAILVMLVVLLFASGAGLYFMFWADKIVYEVKEGIKTAGVKHKSKENLKPIVREYVRESYSLLGVPLPRRYVLLKSIAKFGKPGVDILIEILKDKEEGKNKVKMVYGGEADKSMRIAAVYIISEISEAGKKGHKDFKKAYEAIRKKIPTLVKILLHDKDVEVRIKTAETLGDIGDEQAVDGLIKALDDPGEFDVGQVEPDTVRESAAFSLGEIKTLRAVVPLIKTLERERERILVVSNIAIALEEIGDRSAVAPLIHALEKKMAEGTIIESIGKLGGG